MTVDAYIPIASVQQQQLLLEPQLQQLLGLLLLPQPPLQQDGFVA